MRKLFGALTAVGMAIAMNGAAQAQQQFISMVPAVSPRLLSDRWCNLPPCQ